MMSLCFCGGIHYDVTRTLLRNIGKYANVTDELGGRATGSYSPWADNMPTVLPPQKPH